MFLDDFSDLSIIAQKSNFAIFATEPQPAIVKKDDPSSPILKSIQKFLPGLKISFLIEPNEKGKIDIEAIRSLEQHLNTKQTSNLFIVVYRAETMTTQAANAFLKNLEEPGNHYHFIFFTKAPSALLPTVLSRAQVYYLRQPLDFSEPPQANEKTKQLAKELIAATPAQLPALAEYYHKQKPDVRRQKALEVTATAIEMLYKSYFLTQNPALLKKLPKFLQLYEALQKNGHVKLHLVADLI